jgi:hypothetical protein
MTKFIHSTLTDAGKLRLNKKTIYWQLKRPVPPVPVSFGEILMMLKIISGRSGSV